MSLTVWAAVAAVGVVVLNAARCRGYAKWFHPLSLPLGVITVMSLAAPLWVQFTRLPAGLIYNAQEPPLGASLLQVPLSGTACAALVLVIAGYVAGVVLALAMVGTRQAGPATPRNWGRMRQAGLALIAAAAAGRLAADFLARGHAYGTGQVQYGAGPALAAAASELILPGLVLVTLTAFRPGRPERLRDLLRGREWLALGIYAVAVAGAGERAGLIAPAVYLAWAYATQVRPLRLRWVVACAVVALTAGAVISGYRSGGGVHLARPGVTVQDAAGDVSSAPWLTEQTVIHVPATTPFAHGATYLAALESQVPGPLARQTGATSRTASAVFRSIIGFYDPDQGFAESLPSEAFLNFGLGGCLGAGLFLGAFTGWAWRRRQDAPSRALGVLYPVLIAGLAYGFRSDALTQVKDVLYPALAVWIVMAWCRVSAGETIEAAYPRTT